MTMLSNTISPTVYHRANSRGVTTFSRRGGPGGFGSSFGLRID